MVRPEDTSADHVAACQALWDKSGGFYNAGPFTPFLFHADIAWPTPLGLTEALPEDKRNTGNSGSAGPTATAGGLVFVGATTDRRFRAFDAKPGRSSGSWRCPGKSMRIR